MLLAEQIDESIVIPIVYASEARYIGASPGCQAASSAASSALSSSASAAGPAASMAPSDATHQWTVSVRSGCVGGDNILPLFFEKISFYLHESFQPPRREFTRPPYAVAESGWGEFDIAIELICRDRARTRIEVTHPLRLYPPTINAVSLPPSARPVVYETCDRIVFYKTDIKFPAGFDWESLRKNAALLAPSEHFLQAEFETFAKVSYFSRRVDRLLAAARTQYLELSDQYEQLKRLQQEHAAQKKQQLLPPPKDRHRMRD